MTASAMLVLLQLGLLAAGCAHGGRAEDPVVRAARTRLGAPAVDDGHFLGAVLATGGHLTLSMSGGADAGWLHALARMDDRLIEQPKPGAVIFFAQTVRSFHAGVVERIEGARVTFLHASRGRVRRGVCDLARPSARRDARGRVVNSYLVPRRRDDLPGTRYLCGQLVAGFARF